MENLQASLVTVVILVKSQILTNGPALYAMHTFPDFFNEHFASYFLFIYSLFNYTFSSSYHIASNDKMMVNNEL
jgi:hypothetical protein